MAIELTTASESTLTQIRQAVGIPLLTDLFPNGRFVVNSNGYRLAAGPGFTAYGSIVNFTNCENIQAFSINGSPGGSIYNITTLLNGHTLSSLSDVGTEPAIYLYNNSISAAELSAFFTDLPTVTDARPVTIDVRFNPFGTKTEYAGVSASIVAIATNKNYIVRA
jgi:hypothetical protein